MKLSIENLDAHCPQKSNIKRQWLSNKAYEELESSDDFEKDYSFVECPFFFSEDSTSNNVKFYQIMVDTTKKGYICYENEYGDEIFQLDKDFADKYNGRLIYYVMWQFNGIWYPSQMAYIFTEIEEAIDFYQKIRNTIEQQSKDNKTNKKK